MGVSSSRLKGEWNIVEMNGNQLVGEDAKPRLAIEAVPGKFSGYAGCNAFAGEVALRREGRVRFLRIVSTRKACLDMRMEDALLRALNEVRYVEGEGETNARLIFYDTNRRRLFAVERPLR
jgi:heat shock protein HslJ